MFALCVSGRIFGTKVALVSVGAEVGSARLTRWLFTAAGRFAFYRSYRDELSRDAMAQQGLDTSRDRVYPDLAFGLPVPSSGPGAERTVGIGLMDYYGNDDSHGQPDDVRALYVEKMKSFTRWLVDNGRQVRLFVGDTNNADETVVEKILADLRTYRPDLDPTWVVADPVVTFADLMRAMEPAGIVVATRYHNVVCALMLSKPTISIGYGEKNAVLMADAGLAEYCQSVDSLDVERLIAQFTELERHAARLRERSPRETRQRCRSSRISSRSCRRYCSERSLWLGARPARQASIRRPDLIEDFGAGGWFDVILAANMVVLVLPLTRLAACPGFPGSEAGAGWP